MRVGLRMRPCTSAPFAREPTCVRASAHAPCDADVTRRRAALAPGVWLAALASATVVNAVDDGRRGALWRLPCCAWGPGPLPCCAWGRPACFFRVPRSAVFWGPSACFFEHVFDDVLRAAGSPGPHADPFPVGRPHPLSGLLSRSGFSEWPAQDHGSRQACFWHARQAAIELAEGDEATP